MAYVRRTEKLIEAISSKIDHMRVVAMDVYDRKNALPGDPIMKDMAEAVLSQAWELNPSLQDTIPDEWCYYTNTVFTNFNGEDGVRVVGSAKVVLDGDKTFRLPCKPGPYYRDEIIVEHHHQSEALQAWLAAYAENLRLKDEVRCKYREIENQIIAFLGTKTSLNAALKDMPELELYVPDEYMQKLNAPTAPRTKKDDSDVETVSVDREALTALAVAHRISTAAE